MAAPDDDFDSSDVRFTVREVNAEIRRVTAERVGQMLADAERHIARLRGEFLQLREEALRLDGQMMAVIVELGNWIGHLRELKEKEGK